MDVAPQYETFSYQRRVPEQTLLYRVLAENLETFLDRCQGAEHELPWYVEKELRDYLCGVLGHGFVRLKCSGCGKEERALAFSCKGRGFCPSCTGRCMADTAARLVVRRRTFDWTGAMARSSILSLDFENPPKPWRRRGLRQQAALGRARGLSESRLQGCTRRLGNVLPKIRRRDQPQST